MADDFYLSEIKIFSFNFAPKSWAMCNGQILSISQNQALFSLLGTTYGGDGQTTFALPNLQGRVPMHIGDIILPGQAGGEAAHTLTIDELPQHSHLASASNNVADQAYPTDNVWAAGGAAAGFHPAANSLMSPEAIANAGNDQPHNNLAPYLALNFCIALQGFFPSRT